MANILIGDDHAVVRMAVRILLESAGHHVVGEVDCGLDVVEQLALLLRCRAPILLLSHSTLDLLDHGLTVRHLRHGRILVGRLVALSSEA